MSDLAKCLLCGCKPLTDASEGLMVTHAPNDCPLTDSDWMTPEQWTALMGRGEPVAIAKTRREFHEYENSALEDEVGYLVTHVNWVKKPQDVGELKLYTQAPAVDDAAIREAIRTMDDGERLDIFSEYCRCCGSNDPTCQCWNDE